LVWATTAAADQSRLLLTIDTPEPDAVIGDPGGMAFLSGKALALFGEFQPFDIMFVIDASESTSAPSGADIDGDGKIGHRQGEQFLSVLGKILPLPNTDHGDSVLAAEVAAIKILLDQLDPRTTRVGVVGFSGDHDALTPDAYTQVPLTANYEKVRRGLDEILSIGPNGMTNMVSAIDLGTVELLGLRSAYSERREGARHIMLFLTDGRPTLPLLNSTIHNARMAIAKAVRAAKLGIRIDTYAIGKNALKEPVVVVEIARVTRGVFTPILHPKNLRSIFEEVSFAEIETLEIVNKTSQQPSAYQIQNPDGTFSALVPMREGKNTVEVFARATDGTEARRRIHLTFLPNTPVPELAPQQTAQRNRLLENRLLELQKRSLQIQMERDEAIRRKLETEMEREKAKGRAEQMRKELELEMEEPSDSIR
jgi:Mg-chelatase subunit ChlD